MSNERQRRSAKTVIEDMVNEMLHRSNDPDVNTKINVLQTICSKMSWTDLFEKIQNRHRKPFRSADTEQAEKPEPWWQR